MASTHAPTQQRAPLEGVRNFRDVAAAAPALQPGLVFRSGHLGSATAADLTELAGVRRIDLRTAAEVALELDSDPVELAAPEQMRPALVDDRALWTAIRGTEAGRLPVSLTRAEAQGLIERLYAEVIAADVATYRAVLQRLLQTDLPVVIHCSAGKDRTGWAVVLLLTLLGIEDADIEADYVASSLPANQYPLQNLTDQELERVAPVQEAHPDYLAAAWAAVEQRWGSRGAYFAALGIGDHERAALRDRYLRPRSAHRD